MKGWLRRLFTGESGRPTDLDEALKPTEEQEGLASHFERLRSLFPAPDLQEGALEKRLFSKDDNPYRTTISFLNGETPDEDDLIRAEQRIFHWLTSLKDPEGDSDNFLLGFPTYLVGGGSPLSIVVTSQQTFRADRLIIHSTDVSSFEINIATIGPESFIINTNASIFRLMNPHPVIIGKTVGIGQSVRINVSNLSDRHLGICCAMIGKIMKQPPTMDLE